MTDGPRSLTDTEIRTTWNENGQHYLAALSKAHTLHYDTRHEAASAEIRVSVADLRLIIQTLFACQKLVMESHAELRFPDGDKGPNCDYNPFRGVDWDHPHPQ